MTTPNLPDPRFDNRVLIYDPEAIKTALSTYYHALSKLPYIEAVMKESHRWHPVAPLALPHAATQDDVINGYRIPKGALILANNW